MRGLLLVLSFVFILNVNAQVPTCVNGYWQIENFALFTGGEPCEGRIAACSHIGSKSEGWYSYPESQKRFLGYTICKYDIMENYKPVCANIGTKAEGWYVAGNVVQWSNCQGEEAVCIYSGTRSEGWYTFPRSTKSRIVWDNCSDSF